MKFDTLILGTEILTNILTWLGIDNFYTFVLTKAMEDFS